MTTIIPGDSQMVKLMVLDLGLNVDMKEQSTSCKLYIIGTVQGFLKNLKHSYIKNILRKINGILFGSRILKNDNTARARKPSLARLQNERRRGIRRRHYSRIKSLAYTRRTITREAG